IRLECLVVAEAVGRAQQMRGFAEQCMAEYDLGGWLAPDLINNDDVSWVLKRFHEQQG
ncbi:MAG: 4-hydroxyphenylacetate 3-monooxygenase, partial [Chloroflexota bacterium]